MTETVTHAKPRRPWGEALGTFFVTLALGPPIGGLVFSILIGLLPVLGIKWATEALDPEAGLVATVFVAVFAIPFSYFVGGIQAAAVGLGFAIYGWLRGRPPFWLALLLGALSHFGAIFGDMNGEDDWYVIFMIIHMVPAIGCWAVVRLFWPKVAA